MPNLSRREALGALGAPAILKSQRRGRPNFLFLIADDHAGYVMGCDGNPLAETPNLDRLASQGTRFARHHCNSPVCTPSRQSLLTGLLPHAAGVTRLPTRLDRNKATLAKQFQTAGYATAVFGKMHFNQPAEAGLHGFATMLTEAELQKQWMAEVKPREIPSTIRTKPQWRPFRDPSRIWLNAEKLPFPRHREEMKSAFLLRQGDAFLEAHRDKPFALWLSFQEPHSPYDFPVEDRDAIAPARFTAPRVGPEDAWQIPKIFRDLTDAEKQGIAAAYYTSARYLDSNIGRVLRRLSDLGLDDNTYIVYLADHGYCLGQHGRFEKHCGYAPALHVPLIMRMPGRVRHGVVRDLTEHLDVAPTITDMLGLDPLPGAQGKSLRPYLEGRKTTGRDHIFSEYLENEEAFIRTDRWKFIFCSGRRARGDGYDIDTPTPGRYIRLYDLKSDPGEFTNVGAKHPKVVEAMEDLLLTRFRATHPESQAEPQRLSREEALEWYVRPRDV